MHALIAVVDNCYLTDILCVVRNLRNRILKIHGLRQDNGVVLIQGQNGLGIAKNIIIAVESRAFDVVFRLRLGDIGLGKIAEAVVEKGNGVLILVRGLIL